MREVQIDRAVYAVDDATRSYRFLRRSPAGSLDPVENERNKRSIDGYTRILRTGRRRLFHYRG